MYLSDVKGQSICFTTTTNYSVAASPWSIVSADFNLDGKLDAAVTSNASNYINLLFGDGLGGFTSLVTYTVGTAPWGITCADFNKDGAPDLAVANSGGNNINVLYNNGSGSFLLNIAYTVGNNPRTITHGDFNSDGNIDIAVANYQGQSISILRGNGSTSFINIGTYPLGNTPGGLTTGDFNNDSNLDIAVTKGFVNEVVLFLGSPTGTFSLASQTYTVGNAPRAIKSADFNKDGNLDLAVANWNSASVAVLLGTGLATFTSNINYYSFTGGPYSIECKDYNNDSNIDIVTDKGILFLGDGTGVFSTLLAYNVTLGANWVCDGDFDNNGMLDLATADNNVSSATVYLNLFPKLNVISSQPLICLGQSVNLSVNGATNYTWSIGSNSNTIAVSPTTTTTYSVIGTYTNGCYSSASLTQTVSNCTGFEEKNELKNYDVLFPIPTQGFCYLKTRRVKLLNLYDVLGSRINSYEINNEETVFDFSSLSTGIYFYETVDDNQKSKRNILIVNR